MTERGSSERPSSTQRDELARDLTAARERTLALVDFDDDELRRQYHPLMSPLVWDLAHIGQQEELWLLRDGNPDHPSMLAPRVESLYDAFEHSRASRADLPLMSPEQARGFCRTVREKALDALDALPDEHTFAFGLALSHEHQHDETMLQALNLRVGEPLLQPGAPLPDGRPGVAGTSVLVSGGPFVLGVDAAAEPYSLDNERPAHVVDVPPFRIGRVPVTNAEWQAFVDDGGYRHRPWWSERGWEHREQADLNAPQFWNGGDLKGTRTRFGRVEDIPPDEPVQHVTYFEAEAYASWAGARLPTEIEWEKACAWDPATGRRRRFPWGDSAPTREFANLGGAALRPAPVGAYPDGASAYGAEQMLGDVWEWTSSPLRPWPGFTPMIYERYSQPFFEVGDSSHDRRAHAGGAPTATGRYRVLRGGSWAVAYEILRPSFRNWDHPIRRQIFSGVRLAWDV
jgi:iron(II)-dependent oxidoreductase